MDIDAAAWRGYPCDSDLGVNVLFVLQRPGATVRHIVTGGGQVRVRVYVYGWGRAR